MLDARSSLLAARFKLAELGCAIVALAVLLSVAGNRLGTRAGDVEDISL